MEQKNKPWYQKKRYLVPLGIILLFTFVGVGNADKSPTPVSPSPVSHIQKTPQPAPPIVNSNLSNNNYYTNVSGNQVHSPAYSNTLPIGASAKCGDGTYSFSEHRSGTCSHHGGVSRWL